MFLKLKIIAQRIVKYVKSLNIKLSVVFGIDMECNIKSWSLHSKVINAVEPIVPPSCYFNIINFYKFKYNV